MHCSLLKCINRDRRCSDLYVSLVPWLGLSFQMGGKKIKQIIGFTASVRLKCVVDLSVIQKGPAQNYLISENPNDIFQISVRVFVSLLNCNRSHSTG